MITLVGGQHFKLGYSEVAVKVVMFFEDFHQDGQATGGRQACLFLVFEEAYRKCSN